MLSVVSVMSQCSENPHSGKKRSCRIKRRLAQALGQCGYEVDGCMDPLRLHSHCAGMDSPAFALAALGVNNIEVVATEVDPHAALFHVLHHPSTEHLIADMKHLANGDVGGPCWTHGGKKCTWGHTGDLSAVFSSFVCKPWSRANPKRHKADPCVERGKNKSVDMFYYTRDILARFEPKVFILENVDGVTARRTDHSDSQGCTTPLQFMLDDPTHGLRQMVKNGKPLYTVECVSGVTGTSAGVPQERPRTIFFGVRTDLRGMNAKDVARCFADILQAYGGAGPAQHVDDFIRARKTGIWSDDEPVKENCDGETLDEHISYCTEFKKACNHLRKKKYPDLEAVLMPPETRPSKDVVGTPRLRATLDVSLVIRKHVEGCSGSGCRCHPLADISQRPDRASTKTDGTLPTLMTSSQVFSYQTGQFVSPRELVTSMGYKPANITFMTPSAARTLVGNGYVVQVCECAVAAACLVTGHVKDVRGKKCD